MNFNDGIVSKKEEASNYLKDDHYLLVTASNSSMLTLKSTFHSFMHCLMGDLVSRANVPILS